MSEYWDTYDNCNPHIDMKSSNQVDQVILPTSVRVPHRKPKSLQEAKNFKESYYYWLRKRYNTLDKESIERSALFIFINKTCFRGMYREGPHGYNVPYGHYKRTPTIITKSELDTISELIQEVEFIHSDFTDSIQKVSEGDFVYIDPPYAPETTNSFVGYVAGGFSLEMHNALFDSIKKMKNIKMKSMK